MIRYFGSKEGLFARAAVFDLALPDLTAANRADVGRALVRHFLAIWEGPTATGGMTVLLRSAASNPIAADKLREIFAEQVLPTLARAADAADARERAGLVASQLLGLALCRYVLRLPPVVAIPPERIIRDVGETLQRYLDGPA